MFEIDFIFYVVVVNMNNVAFYFFDASVNNNWYFFSRIEHLQQVSFVEHNSDSSY